MHRESEGKGFQIKEMQHLGTYWQKNRRRGSDPLDNNEGTEQFFNIRLQRSPGVSTVSIGPHWTVSQVKLLIAKDSGIKPEDIDLYFGGEKLVPETFVSTCGILSDSILTVVLHSTI
jgi:hypothetical protein